MYDVYKELNIVIDYIEEHILEEINIKELSKISGLNSNTLKNVFNLLTGVTISEYIRLRRLSLSVTDILNGESITSIAYKYLYNSPSSYNRAFKKYEGVTPRELKNNNRNLKLFNKIVFSENIKNYNIDYKIYKNKEFNLYGISKEVNYSNRTKEIPKFWKEVKSKYPDDGKRYGFLEEKENDKAMYYCLYEKKLPGLKKLNIKKCNYFVIKTSSFESENIIKSIKKGLHEYIKSLNYKILDTPNIEIYYDDYVEILIPIT